MNIFEELRKDHDTQRGMIEQLKNTSGDTEDRQRIFLNLKQHLKNHADAEERYFYVPLFEDDLTQDKARHSVAEHKELDDYIETLTNTDMSSSSWSSTFDKLAHRLIHHLDEEEREVFQLAGKSLENSEKASLADDYREYMKQNK